MDGPSHSLTRTRTIRPSSRLRQSPDPTRIQQRALPSISPNVILHPDDATSKVFHAISTAFLSVDNKAMTIKDLSELAMQMGLPCQNVSAASQAITTYIRAHMQRCETQQDQPLLLKHGLSGTPADDQLLPALHSRSGGAHVDPSAPSSSSDLRLTNFRRGTVVWYLSRVTGAPCPFARAGISLASFVDLATKDTYYKKRKEARIHQEQCGQKRKRRSARGCVLKHSSDDRLSSPLSPVTSSDEDEYESDSSQAPSDVDQPPPAKVKLTLKLPPLAQVVAGNRSRSASAAVAQTKDIIDLSKESDDDDDDDDDDPAPSANDSCLPPYPRRSISIPSYTPCTDYTSYPIYSRFPPLHNSVDLSASTNPFRRSPSVPYSVASPPPDSDEEGEHSAEAGPDDDMIVDDDDVPHSVSDDDDDEDEFTDNWDEEDEEDEEHSEHSTTWESPGPRSPSAPPHTVSAVGSIKVKEEPRDVQGLLDQWEDELDLVEAKHSSVPDDEPLVKVEESYPFPLGWDWDLEGGAILSSADSSSSPSSVSPSTSAPTRIKQEDDLSPADLSLSFSGPSFTTWRQSSSSQNEDFMSPTTPAAYGLSFASAMPSNEGDLFPTSPTSPCTWEHSPPGQDYSTIRPRARTVPSLSLNGTNGFLAHQAPDTPRRPPPVSTDTHSLSSLVYSLSMRSPMASFGPRSGTERLPSDNVKSELPPPCVSPSEIRKVCCDETAVVVTTCEPCVPQLCATHVEGIAVYQSSLGPYTLLRRIDTDFVNLSPIVYYARTTQPACDAIPGATLVTKGREEIRGLWVPLDAARKYVKELTTRSQWPPALDLFLADDLVERFPSALRQFVWQTRESITKGPLMGQFGKSFGGEHVTNSPLPVGAHPPNPTLIAAAAAAKGTEASQLPSSPSGLGNATIIGMSMHATSPVDVPLSATEEEIFAELCVNLEWEKDPEQMDGVDTMLSTSQSSSSMSSTTSLQSSPSLSGTRRAHVECSPSPPSSPLSSCPSSPELARANLPVQNSPCTSETRAADTSSTLRRSKRVADAMAARSRTRSIKRGSRNLS